MAQALSIPCEDDLPLPEGPRPVENFEELKGYLAGGLDHFDWKIEGGIPLEKTTQTGDLIQDSGNGMVFERTPDGSYRLSINLHFVDSTGMTSADRSDHWDAYVFELSSTGAFVRGQVTRRGEAPVAIYGKDYLNLSNRCLHPDSRSNGSLAQYQATPRYAQEYEPLRDSLTSLLEHVQIYGGFYKTQRGDRNFTVERRPEKGSWVVRFKDEKDVQQEIEINPQGGCAWASFHPEGPDDSPLFTVNRILRDIVRFGPNGGAAPSSSSGWTQ